MGIRERINENPLLDVAILTHGFSPHMRDYDILIEAMWIEEKWGDGPGRYLCRFLHCPEAHLVTSVSGPVWRQSWNDTFTDYTEWQKKGEPEGFVWGVSWSMAFPGLKYVDNSKLAAKWSKEFEVEMHEAIIETNAFNLELVFHDFSITKLSDQVDIIDKLLIPVKSR